jgi:hypothetical protein
MPAARAAWQAGFVDALPAGTPFTFRITLGSMVFVDVAGNVCAFPTRTEPVIGFATI